MALEPMSNHPSDDPQDWLADDEEEMIDDLICTCDSDGHMAEDHEVECDLWADDAFLRGYALWSSEHGRLLYEDLDSDMEIIYGELMGEQDSHGSVFDPYEYAGTGSVAQTPGTAIASARAWANLPPPCRHYLEKVRFPDGTVVYASSSHHRSEDEPIPQLGIYLDGIWKPDTIAFSVGCPDRGVPIPEPWQVLHIVREGLRVAREGGMVEVGCIGGHGRTGMMLAIMGLVIAHEMERRLRPERIINWVRKNYCDQAIESELQEWYVAGMAAELKGRKWPPRPKPKTMIPVSTYGITSARRALEWRGGMEKCEGCHHYTLHAPGIKVCPACVNTRCPGPGNMTEQDIEDWLAAEIKDGVGVLASTEPSGVHSTTTSSAQTGKATT